jgi:hypothetical protein
MNATVQLLGTVAVVEAGTAPHEARDPLSLGYHRWAVGASVWKLDPVARQPIPGVNLAICAEAWSSHQGWSLGALMTAERTLQDRLGLAPPDWLASDVNLGA